MDISAVLNANDDVFVSVDRIEVSNYLLDHRVLFGFFIVFCLD